MVALVHIHAQVSELNLPLSELRHDESNVAGEGDHGVRSVGAALLCAQAVGVHVGDDAQAMLATDIPQRGKAGRRQRDVVVMERIGLELLVRQEPRRDLGAGALVAKQERATFADS